MTEKWVAVGIRNDPKRPMPLVIGTFGSYDEAREWAKKYKTKWHIAKMEEPETFDSRLTHVARRRLGID